MIAMTRTSKSMLNNSGESGHFCLVLILEDMLSVFTIENNTCCGFVIYGLYCVEVYSLSMPTLLRVIIVNGC